MRLPWRFLLPALAFAGLVVFFVIGLQKDPGRIESPLIGKPAPAFALESLGDAAWKVGSADFAGPSLAAERLGDLVRRLPRRA